jgi:hypothetical protein
VVKRFLLALHRRETLSAGLLEDSEETGCLCVINVRRDVNVTHLFVRRKSVQLRSQEGACTSDWGGNQLCMENLSFPYRKQQSQPMSEDEIHVGRNSACSSPRLQFDLLRT